MHPMTFVDLVVLALAVPCTVLVLSVYVLLAAALIGNVRDKFATAPSGAGRHAPVKG